MDARGHPIKPKIESILECVALDASVLDYPSFEAWVPDLGYDRDSRKGEKVYRACLDQTLALSAVIGRENLQALRDWDWDTASP
jgi:hypothetical protein